MEPLIPRLAQLFNDTLSSDDAVVSSATEALERLSVLAEFPFSLVSIATGGENQGQRIAAATYLKNFTGRRIGGNNPSSKVSNEFRTCLLGALLQSELAVLKVLVEAFRIIVVAEFVKENSWPELISELRSVIQNSNLISEGANFRWNTINGLIVLQAVIRPFQYFLDPKLVKEPVPPQLELIAKEILVPLLTIFHHSVDKVLSIEGGAETETERILLIICKCMYFAVRSHMPSALVPLLPTFCRNLFRVLDSLVFDGTTTSSEGCLLRLKTGKRSLLIFLALVTRHRKHSDKLMPDMINSVFRIVKQSCNTTKLDFLSERIISSAFDVISHVMETGAGWRLVSPHFSSLLDSAIFPALVMKEKDVAEWEEDADEYIRKNLPSDLEEISGWKEDSFTARKSAINLLGVISISKGPPVVASSSKRKKGDKKKGKEQYSSVGELLVLPFLSQFPIPSAVGSGQARISNDYYGVLMAYGSLQDFLRERNPGYTTSLVQTRVLPLYSLSPSLPYLVATANWVLGVLASCLSQEMSADIYSSLLKALTMPDFGDTSCYPVRVSAAGAIAELLENDYPPPEWLPLLQVVASRVDIEDENESSILFQLLSTVVEAGNENVAVHIPSVVSSVVGAVLKFIPPNPEPWPQVVERGFAALAVMAKTWEVYVAEQIEQDESSSNWQSGWVSMARTFSVLLQQAWLTSMQPKEGVSHELPPSCIDDASTILRAIMRSVTDPSLVSELKLSDLLVAWADLIAEWHAWEELEDLSIFDSIREVVNLQRKCELNNLIIRGHPAPPAQPVPQRSIVEGIGAFVSEAISQYPSAIWRACSCVHLLLHVLSFSYETEGVKQSLVITFSRAAFSRFREIRSKPSALWKPLLLAISSCYLCYPDIVERILEKDEDQGFTVWASALSYISTSSFEPGLSPESEIKLIVMILTKVVERLLEQAGGPWSGLLQDCFVSLVEATIRLKEVQEEVDEDDGEDEDDVDVETDEDDDDDEDSEDEREETEQEFLDRYAEEALALENGMIVEEGDVEDQDQELELGKLVNTLTVTGFILSQVGNCLGLLSYY
ncbi:importin beta-like SAD2 [Telopea speciosissima]|uniref:importin beta-like SAD2 n=1 Tax=Telopea speciosissima TaxID=54955 RepID=UPI001CC7AA62|nr:importin beta-like SAD2 [Telopea speciosissima]